MASTNPINETPSETNLLSLPVIGALLAIYTIWSATRLGTVIASESYPPFMLVAIQLFSAMLILLAILKVRGTPLPSTSQILNGVVIGGLMFGGRAGLLAFAQSHEVGRGMASLGVATVPMWATLFAFMLGYRPGKLELIGLAVGIGGMVLLNIGSEMQSDPFGVVILLFAPMTWAFGSMYSNHLKLPKGFMGTAFQMIGGAVVLMMMSIIQGEQFPTNPTLPATTALIFLAIFGTLVAFSAYMYLVRTVSPGLATSYAYVNPVAAAVLGFILIGDPLAPTSILAIVVVAIGVGLVMMGKTITANK